MPTNPGNQQIVHSKLDEFSSVRRLKKTKTLKGSDKAPTGSTKAPKGSTKAPKSKGKGEGKGNASMVSTDALTVSTDFPPTGSINSKGKGSIKVPKSSKAPKEMGAKAPKSSKKAPKNRT